MDLRKLFRLIFENEELVTTLSEAKQRGASGSPTRMCGVSFDVTPLKVAERELQRKHGGRSFFQFLRRGSLRAEAGEGPGDVPPR